MKDQKRHHQVHPPSAVSPNLSVNKKPNFAPPEKAAVVTNPNPNPGVDAANSRVPAPVKALTRENLDDCDVDLDEDCDLEIS